MAGCAQTSGHAAKGAEGRASKRMSLGEIQANGANRHSIHWKLYLEEAFVDGFCTVFLQAEACSKKHQSRSILYISRTFKTGLTFFNHIYYSL